MEQLNPETPGITCKKKEEESSGKKGTQQSS